MMVRTAAILSGGEGRRLGGLAKESILMDGEALGPRLVRLLARRFGRIIVVTKNPGLYEGLGAETTADILPGMGPLSGLHAAFSQLGPGRDEWIWLAAVDMPGFDPGFVDLLEARLESSIEALSPDNPDRPGACMARFAEHFEPFQAIWSSRLLPDLEQLLHRRSSDGSTRHPSFSDLVAICQVSWVSEKEARIVSPDWRLFHNINRIEDFASSEALFEVHHLGAKSTSKYGLAERQFFGKGQG
ncbi:MAG: molybdenum cofactor guanylyltransferase [Spirochaetota bacterium]